MRARAQRFSLFLKLWGPSKGGGAVLTPRTPPPPPPWIRPWAVIKFDRGHEAYSDMRPEVRKDSDRGQGCLLKSTCDMGLNKLQQQATWAFLKFDTGNRDPLSRPPCIFTESAFPPQLPMYNYLPIFEF